MYRNMTLKGIEKIECLMIEPTNVCNLDCPICASSSKTSRGFMSFEDFKKVVGGTSVRHINLWGLGEPFLNADISKMIDYAGKNMISLCLHTNGNVLSEEVFSSLERNNMISVSFSIDGVSQKTYEAYRRGGSLKKAMSNMIRLANDKKEKGLNNLKVIWQFLIMKTNEHEIGSLEDKAKKIGVDELVVKNICVSRNHPEYDNFIPSKKYAREANDVKSGLCHFIDPGMPVVLWNGDVVVCCHSSAREYVMGNAFKENIVDIWQSKKYVEFRKKYKKGENDFCNTRCKFAKDAGDFVKKTSFL